MCRELHEVHMQPLPALHLRSCYAAFTLTASPPCVSPQCSTACAAALAVAMWCQRTSLVEKQTVQLRGCVCCCVGAGCLNPGDPRQCCSPRHSWNRGARTRASSSASADRAHCRSSSRGQRAAQYCWD